MTSDVAAVRVSKLSRSYLEGGRRHHVLQQLDMQVAPGEIVALRGRSGSGKSTLLNLISGIDMADSGEIEVAGKNLVQMSERNRTLFRRQHIGFVYQSFNLIPTLTVADNVKLVLELNRVNSKAAEERTRFLLETVGLQNRAGSYPDVLSGGEQQRIAIARAIAHEPSLLLADEPTGNLDDQTAASVLELLIGVVRKVGGTMLVATHSSGVARRSDRVLELHDGKLQS